MTREQDVIRQEFERVAPTFGARTAGRFDHMGVVEFSRVAPNETVAEVGVGTGNFLSLFAGHAARLVGVDLTPAMLAEAQRVQPDMELVAGDGRALPLASGSIDLVTSAQAFHHIRDPLPVVREMRRVASRDGRVLIVDQVATENLEEARAMTELDLLRDPSHAICRPVSAFRILALAGGLEILDEKVVASEERLSRWMTPEEFPQERIDAVRGFIETRGGETGMEWARAGDDWVYLRKRLMLLARRAR